MNGRETILFVEDEPAVCRSVKKYLAKGGYEVFTACTGAEAIEVWENHCNEINLLLTDMVMPGGMTGQELAARLSKQRPDLKVLFTSGYSRESVKLEDVNCDFDFVQKPYEPQQLLSTIRACLDRP